MKRRFLECDAYVISCHVTLLKESPPLLSFCGAMINCYGYVKSNVRSMFLAIVLSIDKLLTTFQNACFNYIKFNFFKKTCYSDGVNFFYNLHWIEIRLEISFYFNGCGSLAALVSSSWPDCRGRIEGLMYVKSVETPNSPFGAASKFGEEATDQVSSSTFEESKNYLAQNPEVQRQ
ncbi:hypothetical protein TNCV_765331 [Trichonephila clavipes]|nr:hypothetical protein TNCV_765331 [Trichonephila clavipes]